MAIHQSLDLGLEAVNCEITLFMSYVFVRQDEPVYSCGELTGIDRRSPQNALWDYGGWGCFLEEIELDLRSSKVARRRSEEEPRD